MHPCFLRYQNWLEGRFSNRKELLAFLTMVKIKEGKLKWALQQKDKKNKELAFLLGIKVRRLQQLRAEYRRTGTVPKLNWDRRPRTELSEDEKNLILKAVRESGLKAAVTLRLHIRKYYCKNIPHNKIHAFMLKEGLAVEDEKKKKQRKYCRYERKHSFSLGHMDVHDSKAVPGKYVIAWEDDASRLILAGDEFDEATTEKAIGVVRKAKKVAWEKYSAVLRELNTDRGSQFYANKAGSDGEKGVSEFELFLAEEGIKHIASRRNHPQTNGKEERWFRTYEENRRRFKSFKDFVEWYNNRIHLGLSRKEGFTPNEAVFYKLPQESMLGLFFRRCE